jgi:hypothetical protein
MAVGSALVLAVLFLLDPLEGAATASWLLATARFVVAVAAIFFGYRAVTDYDEADGRKLHEVALRSPIGAGMALISRAIVLVAMAIIFASVSQAQTIPSQAPQHLPVLKQSRLSIGQL